MSLVSRLQEWHEQLVSWRRELHAHPQTAFEETYASEFIGAKLRDFGIGVHTGMAKTGVVGTLVGSGAATGQPRAIALRADIDALDIHEQNDLPYKSQFPGKMHACGHDGHTTMLLAAAKYLAETRRFAGTVHFIFQPAEENEGGGRVMVEEGLFDRFPVEAVFGLHNWPGMAIGAFAVANGPAMAAFDVFEIVVTGRGTHAAMPHAGVDPIVVGSQIVSALQTIASRETDPLDQIVVSVTQFHAGDTWNVIPEQATLRGTVRTFQETTRARAEKSMDRIATSVAAALGARAKVRYERRYPATVNTPRETEWAAAAAVDVVGKEHVARDAPPCMGSEDFAYMLQVRPGCYIWAGNGSAENGRLLHSPHYDFNDELLPVGASYWVRLVERLLPSVS
ncbi:MAG TPA: M20 aminoacylase family protein [Planctomycetaceae bacterium]|nr:M20 aminoacylase family protein [Planctomycetaceae bacterium]